MPRQPSRKHQSPPAKRCRPKNSRCWHQANPFLSGIYSATRKSGCVFPSPGEILLLNSVFHRLTAHWSGVMLSHDVWLSFSRPLSRPVHISVAASAVPDCIACVSIVLTLTNACGNKPDRHSRQDEARQNSNSIFVFSYIIIKLLTLSSPG